MRMNSPLKKGIVGLLVCALMEAPIQEAAAATACSCDFGHSLQSSGAIVQPSAWFTRPAITGAPRQIWEFVKKPFRRTQSAPVTVEMPVEPAAVAAPIEPETAEPAVEPAVPADEEPELRPEPPARPRATFQVPSEATVTGSEILSALASVLARDPAVEKKMRFVTMPGGLENLRLLASALQAELLQRGAPLEWAPRRALLLVWYFIRVPRQSPSFQKLMAASPQLPSGDPATVESFLESAQPVDWAWIDGLGGFVHEADTHPLLSRVKRNKAAFGRMLRYSNEWRMRSHAEVRTAAEWTAWLTELWETALSEEWLERFKTQHHSRFSERGGKIFHALFIDGKSLKEVAAAEGVSRERIRQIEARVARRIRGLAAAVLALNRMRAFPVDLDTARSWPLEAKEAIPVDALEDIPTGPANVLIYAGYTTLGQVYAAGPFDLLRLRGFGMTGINGLIRTFNRLNLPWVSPLSAAVGVTMATPIDDYLWTNARIYNGLKNAGVKTFGDIYAQWRELPRQHIGRISMAELRAILFRLGLPPPDDGPSVRAPKEIVLPLWLTAEASAKTATHLAAMGYPFLAWAMGLIVAPAVAAYFLLRVLFPRPLRARASFATIAKRFLMRTALLSAGMIPAGGDAGNPGSESGIKETKRFAVSREAGTSRQLASDIASEVSNAAGRLGLSHDIFALGAHSASLALYSALRNAADAVLMREAEGAPRYHGWIETTVLKIADGGFALTIEDNGVGISPQILDQLFIERGLSTKQYFTPEQRQRLGIAGGVGDAVDLHYSRLIDEYNAEIIIDTRDEHTSKRLIVGPSSPLRRVPRELGVAHVAVRVPERMPSERQDRGTRLTIKFPGSPTWPGATPPRNPAKQAA